MTADLMARARAGDGEAFEQLVGPYRRELQVHCYRILGSFQDAEDALQETMLAAWRGLGAFEERAAIRTWLYQVATRRCLNALRSRRRRLPLSSLPAGFDPPAPTRLGEAVWLEPYPDRLFAGLADGAPGPEARYEAQEAMSLAFVTALQLLPPRQSAVLILRDVLGFRAQEVSRILQTTEESVTSALKRARSGLQRRLKESGDREPPPPPGSLSEQEIVVQLTRAYETGDVAGVIALLTDDAWLIMPPAPLEYQGRDLAARFLETVAFRHGRTYRLAATRANGQPAFGFYLQAPGAAQAQANGLLVLTLTGTRISVMARFGSSLLPHFGLPPSLPD